MESGIASGMLVRDNSFCESLFSGFNFNGFAEIAIPVNDIPLIHRDNNLVCIIRTTTTRRSTDTRIQNHLTEMPGVATGLYSERWLEITHAFPKSSTAAQENI